MMLRDAAQSALNDVIVQCDAVAERYRNSAQRVDAPRWSQLFAVRGAQLERMAAQLGADLRTLDDLPSDADPERELLHGLLERLREAFTGEGGEALLRERGDDERALLDTIDGARRQSLPQPVDAHLAHAADLARQMLGRLGNLQERSTHGQ